MAAGYQQRLCHLNGRGRCVPMKQNIYQIIYLKKVLTIGTHRFILYLIHIKQIGNI